MKRIFTISVAAVMALLMVLSLTACGNSTLGYYKLTSAEASGMSFDSSTLAAVGMDKGYIFLKKTARLSFLQPVRSRSSHTMTRTLQQTAIHSIHTQRRCYYNGKRWYKARFHI